jgi:hypothetical protein
MEIKIKMEEKVNQIIIQREAIIQEIDKAIFIKTKDGKRRYKSLIVIPDEFKKRMSRSFLKNPRDRYHFKGKEYRNLEDIPDSVIRKIIKSVDDSYIRSDNWSDVKPKWTYKIFIEKKYETINEIEDEKLRDTILEKEMRRGIIKNIYFCDQCNIKVLGKKTFFGSIKCEFCGGNIKKLL